jgi:tetratricopeptide (TPR) repeat protein
MAYARYLLGYNADGLQKSTEAEEHLLTGLRIAEACDDQVVMIKILYALGHHYNVRSQPQASIATLSRALALARSLGDHRSVAHILCYFGGARLRTGDSEQARHYLQEALDLFRELDVVWGIAQAQHGLLNIAYAVGDYAEARRLCEVTLPIYEKMGAHTEALAEIRRIYGQIRDK